jgi:hypothetical protein
MLILHLDYTNATLTGVLSVAVNGARDHQPFLTFQGHDNPSLDINVLFLVPCVMALADTLGLGLESSFLQVSCKITSSYNS